MFSIRSYHHNGFDIIALEDAHSGVSVEVIPAHGAMLHAFRIPIAGQPLNIIDNYPDLEEYQSQQSTYFKGIKLSPFACRIPDGEYIWQEKQYQVEKSVMHGLLYDVNFIVLSAHANEKGATLVLYHHYEGNDAGYPFPYECTITYELQPTAVLKLSTTIHNLSDGAVPLMDGWHPYFTTGSPVDILELQFNSSQIVEFNAQLVPTGRLLPWARFKEPTILGGEQLDNSFLLDMPQCELRDPLKRVRISLFPDENYRVLQIYIPPHRKSIAIENLTGAPNAFNNGIGLIALGKDAQKTFITTITAGSY